MLPLAFRASLLLVHADVYLAGHDFSDLRKWVRSTPIRVTRSQEGEVEAICRAIDLAIIWYPKQVLCLQRTAATVLLLRQAGIAAEMVIGTKPMPFRTHAWAEVKGQVVGDKPYMNEIYSVLDRC
jgi:hypothetical protein